MKTFELRQVLSGWVWPLNTRHLIRYDLNTADCSGHVTQACGVVTMGPGTWPLPGQGKHHNIGEWKQQL